MRRAFLVGLLLTLAACKKSPVTNGESSSAEECPKDDLAARGSPCSTEGKICGANPAGFTHFLMCTHGEWTEMSAPPPPSSR